MEKEPGSRSGAESTGISPHLSVVYGGYKRQESVIAFGYILVGGIFTGHWESEKI
jgi:hypothetical protein